MTRRQSKGGEDMLTCSKKCQGEGTNIGREKWGKRSEMLKDTVSWNKNKSDMEMKRNR